jgi:hypothetical protein
MRIVAEDRLGSGFDKIRQPRVGIAPPECSEERRREHHVADEPWPHQEDFHVVLGA